jgi:hypothetical protein
VPTVRVYQPQVQQAALPSPRIIQGDTSGYDALARGLGTVASVAKQQADQEIEKTRNARLMDAYAELATGRQDIESVAQQQKGKSALEQDLVSQTGELLDNHAAKITDSLSNDQELVDRFKKIQLEQKMQLRGTVERHVTTESENYQKVSFDTALQKATEGAKREALLGNVPGAQAELGNLRGVIDSYGAGQGWDKDTRDRVLLNATSATHAGVVKGLLAGDAPRPDMATEYLRTHRAEMTTEAISTAETEIRPASMSVKAEQQKSAIVAGATDPKTGVFDPAKALAGAEALPDTDLTKPMVRQLVHQAVAATQQLQLTGAAQAASVISSLYERNGHNLQGAVATPEGAKALLFLQDSKNGLTAQQHWQALEALAHADIQRSKAESAQAEDKDVAPWVKFLGDTASPEQQEAVASMTPEAFTSLYVLGIDPKTGKQVRDPMPEKYRPQAAAHFGAIKQNGTKEALPEQLILQRMRVQRQAPEDGPGVKANDPSTWSTSQQVRFTFVREAVRKELATFRALNEGAAPKDPQVWQDWIDKSMVTVMTEGRVYGSNERNLALVATDPSAQAHRIVDFKGSIPKSDLTVINAEIAAYNAAHPTAPLPLDESTRRKGYIRLLRQRAGQPLEDPK